MAKFHRLVDRGADAIAAAIPLTEPDYVTYNAGRERHPKQVTRICNAADIELFNCWELDFVEQLYNYPSSRRISPRQCIVLGHLLWKVYGFADDWYRCYPEYPEQQAVFPNRDDAEEEAA